MMRVIKLLNLELPLLDLDHGRLVVVHVAVVGGGEDRDHGGELGGAVPGVEFVALLLDFVSADQACQ